MELRTTTPLGFVSGEVEIGAHIMYTYAKRDETFVRNVIDFILAGLSVGEMVACALCGPLRAEIKCRLVAQGVNTDPNDPNVQVFLGDASSVFVGDGLFCPESTTRHCRCLLAAAQERGMGLRVITDIMDLSISKVTRMKLLEYEALWQTDLAFTVAIGAYETSVAMKSYLTEARRLHAFIATSKGIRRNLTHVDPTRFLSSFYRYQRVTKEYPAVPTADWSAIRDFEEIAARTPLTAIEISNFRTALGLLLVHSIGGFMYGGIPAPVLGQHFHVSFITESDKMMVVGRYHAPGIHNANTDYQELVNGSRTLSESLADELRIEVREDLAIVTIVKMYSNLFDAAAFSTPDSAP